MAVSAPAGLAPLIDGPVRGGRVLVSSPRLVQIEVAATTGPPLVVLTDATGLELPNTIVCVSDAAPVAAAAAAGAVRIGGGTLRVGDRLRLRVARWRAHGVVLPPIDRTELLARLEAAPAPPPLDPSVGRPFMELFDAAPGGGDPTPLIGLGPGSTPEGDDLLAGLLAGCVVLGAAARSRSVLTWAERLAADTMAAVVGATTALSASLLRHAADGEVVDEAAAVLRALAGRGDLARAERALAALGHTSGRALVVGLRAAAIMVVLADDSSSPQAEEVAP